MSSTQQALHGFVSGLVQGVFFRAETQRMAVGLGLRGWVRNRPDGRVEVFLQGSVESLEEMRLWLQHGPRRARVEAVELHPVPDLPLDGFTILG